MRPELAHSISITLSRIRATAPFLYYASRTEALYEGFVFSCVVEALIRLGAQFEVHDENNQTTNRLTFRTKPSLVHTGVSHVLVTLNSNQYELYTNIRVLSYSKTLHELDVTLIDHDARNNCHRTGGPPRKSEVEFFAECKLYGRSLPLRLGREYLGLSSEFNVRVKSIVSNVGSDRVHKMVTVHGGTENFEMSPMNPANVMRFVEWLANELRQVLL
jgi:hypothetical protein